MIYLVHFNIFRIKHIITSCLFLVLFLLPVSALEDGISSLTFCSISKRNHVLWYLFKRQKRANLPVKTLIQQRYDMYKCISGPKHSLNLEAFVTIFLSLGFVTSITYMYIKKLKINFKLSLKITYVPVRQHTYIYIVSK